MIVIFFCNFVKIKISILKSYYGVLDFASKYVLVTEVLRKRDFWKTVEVLTRHSSMLPQTLLLRGNQRRRSKFFNKRIDVITWRVHVSKSVGYKLHNFGGSVCYWILGYLVKSRMNSIFYHLTQSYNRNPKNSIS